MGCPPLWRRNGARHFPLSSTRMRRRVALPSRTARSSRGSSKSTSKGSSCQQPPYPRLDPVPAVYPVETVPRPLPHVGYANLMVDSQTLDRQIVRAKVVRDNRLDPVFAREVAEPLHESVRIALDEYFQPQNLPRFGVRDCADDGFHAIHANRSLVRARLRAVCGARFVPLPERRAARSCARPRRRRREKMARGARRQSERPRERNPSAHPQGLSASVGSIRAMPEGALAVGASVSDNRDLILIEVCYGLVRRSALREDLASAACRRHVFRPGKS